MIEPAIDHQILAQRYETAQGFRTALLRSKCGIRVRYHSPGISLIVEKYQGGKTMIAADFSLTATCDDLTQIGSAYYRSSDLP